MSEEMYDDWTHNRNCIKSRKEKCPLTDNCYGLIDDSEDCKCRLEDYQQGRADERERIIKKLEEKLKEETPYNIISDVGVGLKIALEIVRGGENEW